MAIPLGQEGFPLPPKVREIVTKARISWLRNSDVLDLLVHYESYRLKLGSEAPNAPPGTHSFCHARLSQSSEGTLASSSCLDHNFGGGAVERANEQHNTSKHTRWLLMLCVYLIT